MMPAVGVHDNGLPTVEAAGDMRVLAALPGRPSYQNVPVWESGQPLLPRSQWQECSLRNFEIPVLNQGQSSSCVGHAAADAFGRAWLASGQPYRPFSPWFVYGLISGNRDQGAIVGDAMTELAANGVACTGALADGDLPAQLWMLSQLQQQPAVLKKAMRFKVQEARHLTGASIFDQIGSALMLGYSLVSGIVVGRNFSSLDSEGVVPPLAQALGGHALHHCGLKWSAKRSAWVIETMNSWGPQWGLSGYCYLAEDAWSSNLMAPDAFAILADAEDTGDQSNAVWPVAKVA
jgi:hypothetical protein